MSCEIRNSDFVLGLGNDDERTAEHAAQLILDNVSSLLVFTGGQGKVTRDTRRVTEAEVFSKVAIELGVPRDQIILETNATNTGDNFVFTKKLLKSLNIEVETGIIVTKPYMRRRALATANKQWPEITWIVSSPDLSFESYLAGPIPVKRFISLMVGDLQRLDLYAKKGYQIPQTIPSHIWESYDYLVTKGFNDYVLVE